MNCFKTIIKLLRNHIHNKWLGHNKITVLGGGGNSLNISSASKLTCCNIVLSGNNGKVIIEGECRLSNLSILLDGNGSSVYIRKGVVVNALPLSRTCFNAIEGKCIEIGEDSLFSNGIELHTSDYHSIIPRNNSHERINVADDINIGKHVWVGFRTTILKGTSISDNSIVGACSLVCKKIDKSNVLLVGVPARIIRENINWISKKI